MTADPKSKTYDNADPALTYTVTSGSLAIGDSFTGGLSRASGENAGTYAINQGTLAVTSNYTLTYIGANLTIAPRPVTATADPKTKVYGDADPAFTYKITSGSLVNGDTFVGRLTRVSGSNAGTYAIQQGTLALNSNYSLTYVAANLTINRKTASARPKPASKTYGVADPPLTGMLNGFLATDNVTAAYSRISGETVAGSPYTISASLSPAVVLGNYDITYNTADFTINKATATLSLSNLAYTYDGSARQATVTTNPAGLSVVSVTYNGSAALPIDPGSYTVTASLSNANYRATDATGTLVIDKAVESIAFAPLPNKTYGDPAFPISATGGGSTKPVVFAARGTCKISGNTLTITGAGTCTVTASQSGDPSHNSATAAVQSFTIGKATATLAPGNLNQKYDGNPKPVTLTTSPAGLAGVTVTYDGSVVPPTNGGSYVVFASFTNANYQAQNVGGTLIIAAAAGSSITVR